MKNKFLTLLSIVFIFSLFIKCSKDEPIIEFTLTTNISPSDGGTVNPSSGTFESGDKITGSTPRTFHRNTSISIAQSMPTGNRQKKTA